MSVEKKSFPPPRLVIPRSPAANWFVEYYTEEGKRRRVRGNINDFKTEKERRKAAEALLLELQPVIVVEAEEDSSIKSLLYNYLESIKGRWRLKTYQTQKSKLDNFMSWVGHREVHPDLVKAFFEHIQNTLHPQTYNDYVVILRKLFRGVRCEDLMDGVEKIRGAVSSPARYFQSHQVKRLKNYMLKNEPELWRYVQFIYYCFIRPRSELRFLRVEHIIFDDWQIYVPGYISKNKKSEYVSIPDAFRPVVAYYKDKQPKDFLFASPRDKSKPVGFNTMGRKHRLMLRELGFGADYKMYSWKHTGAVACVKAGIGVKELQIQLRHHSLEEVDKYLRQLGVHDLDKLEKQFPAL